MTASRILLYFCLAFIGGIFLSSMFKIPQLLMLGNLIFGLILISALGKYKKIAVFGFCLLFLVLGIWRHQAEELKITKSILVKFNDNEKDITIIGMVFQEPDIREKSIKLIVSSEQLAANNKNIKVDEKFLITTSKYPEYEYGDRLKIIGKLESPAVFVPKSPKATGTLANNGIGDDFNYKDYLKKDRIYSVMYFPEIEILDRRLGNPVTSTLLFFKNKFQTATQSFISPPQEGILEALVFGEEKNISQELKDKLNLTGTRHIAAVSGMNITIVSFIILSFALSLGLWRQQAFYFSIFILFLYILMIGAPSSAVRAGIMAFLLMAAQYFGRLSSASRAVVFAAALMLIFNPLLLTLDVGFQLSFLAILGLIYLQPIFFQYLRIIPDYKLLPIRTTLSATLAAQIFVLPILIYNFGRISLISPITNILIVPFLAPLTILLFIFGIGTILFQPVGFLLFFPAWFSLAYIVKIVDYSSKIPFSSIIINDIHWLWLLFSYFSLAYIVWRLQERQKLKFLNY